MFNKDRAPTKELVQARILLGDMEHLEPTVVLSYCAHTHLREVV